LALVDGDRLTGTAWTPEGSVTLDNGRVTGDAFSFTIASNGINALHTGKIAAGTCELDINGGGQLFHTTLVRSASK
jgi:hypothetical protein